MPNSDPRPIVIRYHGETYWLINHGPDHYITLQHTESSHIHGVYIEDPHHEDIVNQIESQRIHHAILRERTHQDRKRGTPAERKLSITDYIKIIRRELDEAESAINEGNPEHALCELLQATTVGVACIEFHGLVERPENKETN